MKKILIFVLILILHYHNVDAELCPQHKTECPSTAMCCIQTDGSYGCCPYKDGHCCTDKIHCCPAGTHCNMELQSCDSHYHPISFRWMVPVYKYPIFNKPTNFDETKDIQARSIQCPDGTSCPGSATCCQMPDDRYGCCPYQDANCCSDREHCCPSNYRCDLKNNRCVRQYLGTKSKFQKKSKFLPIYNIRSKNFEVMSSQTTCPESNFCKHLGLICCETEGTQYCCPPGLTCSQEEMCSKKVDDLISKSKFRNFGKYFQNGEESTSLDNSPVVCPDKTEVCPPESTCCKMSNRPIHYGCCPLAQATCCPDMLHCCPHGYICAEGGCQRKPFIHLLDKPNFVDQSVVKHTRPTV